MSNEISIHISDDDIENALKEALWSHLGVNINDFFSDAISRVLDARIGPIVDMHKDLIDEQVVIAIGDISEYDVFQDIGPYQTHKSVGQELLDAAVKEHSQRLWDRVCNVIDDLSQDQITKALGVVLRGQ